ncbi:MAG: AAA family ATPase [Caldilineaceae bacterium]|nr:AAA family ATPase [Caldilineaceae bacterium]
MDKLIIDRPPRIQPELPFDRIEIPNPPVQENNGMMQLLQMAMPMLLIVSMLFVTVSGGGGRSYLLVIPMLLSVFGMSGFAFYSYRRERQKREAIRKAYRARLVDLNQEMHNYQDMQRRFYDYNYPDVPALYRIVQATQREAQRHEPQLRTEARVWERRVADEDFGVVRLGIGTLPSTVIYTLSQTDSVEDELAREAMKLADDSRYVENIPVIVALRAPLPHDQPGSDEGEPTTAQDDTPRTPFTHALGIAGKADTVYQFAHVLVAHFALFHAPSDARLYLLGTTSTAWDWTADLPHCQSDQHGAYRCFVAEIAETEEARLLGDDSGDEQAQFLEELRRVLAQRKIRLQDRDGKEADDDPTHPFLLVIIDLLNDAAGKLSELESDAALSILLEEGAKLGAAVIFLVPERSKVPSRCTAVIEVERTTPATNSKMQQFQRIHFRYTEVGVNTFRYVGTADYMQQLEQASALAKRLGQMEVLQGFGANVPASVPFLDFMGYADLHALAQAALTHWQASMTDKHADWLGVKIGRMSGNKPRTLMFSAKRDGVHGMVAGSTGSGKSELLISLITGMAVTYAPSVLNFVLVDYKGGGAFKGLEALPHVVDVITNIQRDGVTRMFTAIQAEMQRRQALNTATNTKNIVDYRQKNLHNTEKPYPFLFIIIDEFAEMIADRPEYKAQLESITRVGRAQGVSLLLAAQRPSGVTDQMRSNIKFRICLRVETTGESREMLRREDAAYLPGNIPGRGFLQVGNEEIELIQVAYTGDTYVDPERARVPVLWPDRDPQYNEEQDEARELYKAIVDRLAQLATQQGYPQPRAPWPDPLPVQLALNQLLISSTAERQAITAAEYLREDDQRRITLGQPPDADLTLNPAINRWLIGDSGWLPALDWERYALRPVVGLVDDPVDARQLPLVIDLPVGHWALFGASGWGKTTFIRTLVLSLAATHSPDQLHIYILDLGGRSLLALKELPHVGAVIIPDEEGYQERVEQLLRELTDIVEARKTHLTDAGFLDLYKYNAANPTKALPAILVAIDNFVEFKETFGGRADDVETALDQLILLARQAKPYGIHLVVTAGRLADLPYQILSLFTERMTLKLGDAGDYRTAIGAGVEDFQGLPGRGYVKVGQVVLACQIAQPFSLSSTEDPNAAKHTLARLIESMTSFMLGQGHPYPRPVRVDPLPKATLLKHLLARQYHLEQNETFLAQLQRVTGEQWAASVQPAQADWLRALLGVKSGNRLWEMHLEAKADGVHGLIAGGTGSGKSELLMTLLVSLALRYDPTVLNFVLVDYKGGGAFQPFHGLPHVVDIVTNLNKSAVRRMFTAINAEMQRRQKLNADTGTKDIVEYRAKGFHLSREPYPHLFIIIDEYAEMIADSPEFKAELDSITRVGRAQGVNLLLAAQRPSGVTDQMRANIKYRICLRVEEVDTSREMLRRADAAYLPNGMPGRGYLQVGNEGIDLIQVAYTGETIAAAKPLEGERSPKFYDVVVQLTQQLLQGAAPRSPWPPFLPAALTLSSALEADYQQDGYTRLRTLGQSNLPLVLNPFVQSWWHGQPSWPGVDWGHTAMRAIIGLVDDPYNACQLPLVLDFTKGHVVLFGASGWGKSTLLRTLVTTLAATHAPDEFQAHMLDLGGRNLAMLAAFPHVGSVILPDEDGYEERIQQLLRELNEVVDERKRLFSQAGVSTLYEYNQRAGVARKPAILVIIDNFAEFIETFGGHEEDETNPFALMIALIRQAKPFGVHFVVTATRLTVLSAKLLSLFTERLTLRLADTDEYRAIVGGNVGEIDEIPGRGYVRIGKMPLEFQTAIGVGTYNAPGHFSDHLGQAATEIEQIRALGKQMGERGAGQWSGQAPFKIGALPKSAPYRQLLADLLGFDRSGSFLEQLEEATRHQWAHRRQAAQAEWLTVPLGIQSGDKPRTLHFAAKADGVHGLIAGGTGSGKSELLMTLIVGLALHYPPDILNFVLVDYKGGGAFQPFLGLPHVVDIVTNLNKAAVNRMFVSIDAEMRRRQALNTATGTKDIIDYRRKGFHLTHAPYPHLFIIIDEYAEMISTNPEYRAALESITRVGRAQGVNLLLAAQRPTGVSDQMRANIKLRICLRVEETDTSHEMLRRRDAAYLPSIPGRGYIQVGNEHLALIQVAYAGERQPDERPVAVVWPEHQRPAGEEGVADQATEDPPFFEAVVALARRLTQGQMAPKPWPNFLPQHFSLQSPLVDAQRNRTFTLTDAVSHWLNGETADLWPGVAWQADGPHAALRPIVGLIDNPAEARQEPMDFTLSRYHLAVHGDSGMGKSLFLRTLLVSLAATHSPDELHAYILDLGGRNFRSLEGLPHVGDVIYADETLFEERLQRLLEMLERLVDERQHLLSETGASNLFEYNLRHADQPLPAVLVLIDNFAELTESYDMLVETVIMPLVRRSLAMGVSFVVTSNIPNNMPSKLYNLFGERITLKQGAFDRYLDIVGRGAVEIDDLPGRGYRRVGGLPLLFHGALPVGALYAGDPTQEADQLRRLAQHMQAQIDQGRYIWRQPPVPVRVLTDLVTLRELLDEVGPPRRPRRIEAVLGRDITLQPALFDLKRMGPHFAVVGPPLAGKTTTLYTWVLSLAYRYAPHQAKFVLVDLQRRLVDYGGAQKLSGLPHVLATIFEMDELVTLVEQLQTECAALAESGTELFIVIDDFDDFSEALEEQRNLGRNLANLARRYGRDGLHFIIAGMLESSINDLKRQIQASNYGIGLRSAQAVDTLRVLRRPPGLQDQELAVGRGFIVKSGQATMIQVAAPYVMQSSAVVSTEVDEDAAEAQMAQALDSWVKLIRGKYSGQQAAWLRAEAASTNNGQGGAVNGELRRALDLLRKLSAAKPGLASEKLDDLAVLAQVVKEEFVREGKGDLFILSTSPLEILTTAADHLASTESNGHSR